ncbi:MAG: redoxin domain-containing protein, partial [Synechococcaceae cyanobacterium]|nr:redoxin domain-containing protein [Synechococcaceae cyanobacterium]
WRLSDFADAKILVVLFTANHCPTAQYYEKRIKQLVADYRGRGVAVVAISPNDPKSVRLDELGWSDLSDSFEEMKQRAQDAAFNFPYLYDGEVQSVSRAYGPAVTPHAFVFDGERRLRYVGRIDDSERPQHVRVQYLRDALDALLEGREPAVTQTRAIGCSVKWAGKAADVEAFMAKLAAEPVTLETVDVAGMKALRRGHPEKFRLVTFWGTLCAPCLAEFHEFVTMHRMYRHRDFEVVTVSMDHPEAERKVRAFLDKQEASMRNLIAGSADRDPLVEAFDPEWSGALPYTVLLSPEGEIIRSELDRIDAGAWRRAIVEVMNARKPW